MEHETSHKRAGFTLTTPTAIIIAGLIIAGAILITKSPHSAAQPSADEGAIETAQNLPPLSANDHLRGDPKAALTVVEYSDLECPFCKVFHETMLNVYKTYGNDGKVAWVYRHFPLDTIHPKARVEARAAECAAEVGGRDAFWSYIDGIFAITPSNNRLELDQLPVIAQNIGFKGAVLTAFNTCLTSERYADLISEQLEGGIDAGVRATPTGFIILKDGSVLPLPAGAQSYETMKRFIEEALKR